jgi:hypothetical protein
VPSQILQAQQYADVVQQMFLCPVQKARTLQISKSAGPFLQNYVVPDNNLPKSSTEALETCRLQAIRLRASHKMELLNTLAMAALVLDAPPHPYGEQPKKRARKKVRGTFRGFGAKK